MRSSRAKAVGLGLALLASPLHAAENPPAAPSAVPPATPGSSWVAAGAPDGDTIWLPSRRSHPAAPANVVPASGAGQSAPAIEKPGSPAPKWLPESSASPVIPAPVAPEPLPGTLGPKPEVPWVQPEAAPIPPSIQVGRPRLPDTIGTSDRGQPEQPLPPPRAVKPTTLPEKETPGPLPRTLAPMPAPDCNLPVAPPELMMPAGVPVPGNHGSFGSPPIRISRDFPALTDLVRGHWWRGGGDDGVVVSEPAIDRLFFQAEYLMWWMRPQSIPALATTSAPGGFGFLGDPRTRVLLGPGRFGDSLRHGMRVRGGYWFDDCGSCGIDASYFFLGRQTTSASFDSGVTPVLTRPFFAPNLNAEFGEIVAFPGVSTGRLDVVGTNSIWGFDVNLRRALCKTCDFRSILFAGYRFLGMDESLQIRESITALPGNPVDPAGTRVVVQDRFATQNRFHGGQVGYAAERNWGRVSLDGRASVALGTTYQQVNISGFQARQRPGMAQPDVFTGGLLAVGPNLGNFKRDQFSVVPEVTINLGYWLTPTIKAYVGYNFLYWSNVVRAGDQIDRVVDVTFVPNPPMNVPPSGLVRPQPTFHSSDLALNGIQFGLMGRW